jgi:hypothetical protein
MPPTRSPSSPPLAPLLERSLEELRAVRRDAAALTGGLSAAQLAWSPAPGRWSMAEGVAHLNRTGRLYLDALAHSLAGARARGLVDRGDYRPGLVGGWMARSMEPPPKIRFRSPRVFLPARGAAAVDGPRELATWRELHLEMEERIREAAGLDLRRTRVVSPASRWLRISAGDALALLLAHERRHLWQMRQVRESGGFPG